MGIAVGISLLKCTQAADNDTFGVAATILDSTHPTKLFSIPVSPFSKLDSNGRGWSRVYKPRYRYFRLPSRVSRNGLSRAAFSTVSLDFQISKLRVLPTI